MVASVEGTNLRPDLVEIWKFSDDIWKISWTSDLVMRTPYANYTERSTLEDRKERCAIFRATRDGIVEESQFRLVDGPTIFAAKVHTIKEAITDALWKCLSEFYIFSYSRSVLQVLFSLVKITELLPRSAEAWVAVAMCTMSMQTL